MKKQGVLVSCVAGLALMLGGCASGASVRGMTVTPAEVQGRVEGRFAQNVMVNVVHGGKSTNAMLTSQIANEDFKAALESSLQQAGLAGSGTARYRVDVELVAVDQPAIGVDMKVTSVVRYVVTNVKTGATALAIQVVAPYTAGLGDSVYGPWRLKIANEGSARQSIATLIKRLNAASKAGVKVATR